MGWRVTTEDSMALSPPSNHTVVVLVPYVPFFAPPPVPPVPPMPGNMPSPIPGAWPPNWGHVEIPVTASYTPGKGQHKFSTKCVHRNLKITVSGHDCGRNILQAPIPLVPLNLVLPLTIMGSQRKSTMTTSLVKMDTHEVALSAPLPYQYCSFLPLCIAPVLTFNNSVLVGCTFGDVALGAINVAVDCAVAVATHYATAGTPAEPATLLKELGLDGADPKSLGIGLVGSFVKGGASYLIKGKGKFEVSVGSPAFGVKYEVEVEQDKKTGGHKVTRQGEVVVAGPDGTTSTNTWKWNDDGTEEHESKTNAVDGREHKTTTKTDKGGKETTEWEQSGPDGQNLKGKGEPPSGHQGSDILL